MVTVNYDYVPHAIQAEAHAMHVDEILYGGAGGGGKSRWARAEAFYACMAVAGLRAIIFRRTFPDLERSVVDPLLQEIPPGVGKYNRSDHKWRFANGSVLELGHLQNANDLLKYQGAEYQLIIFEEATHFTEYQYTYMMSRLRAAGPVAQQLAVLGLRPRMIATANPGGPGHHFIKQRFVDPCPPRTVFKMAPSLEEPNPGTRCYIPARATDNPSLDGGYIDRLNALPENLRRALRDGDWNVLDGVRFPQWRESHHVIIPDISPMDLVGYPRVVSIDYGFADPFAATWIAKLPDGTNLVYRELYAKELTATQQAELILASEMPGERTEQRQIPVVMDPSMWRRNQAGGNSSPLGDKDAPPVGSPAHDYQRVMRIRPIKAYNARVPGWSRVDELLRLRDNGLPLLQVFDTCRDLIRTLPAIPRDKKNPEDVDTTTEDHILDALRYGLMYLNGQWQQVKETGPPTTKFRPATAKLATSKF